MTTRLRWPCRPAAFYTPGTVMLGLVASCQLLEPRHSAQLPPVWHTRTTANSQSFWMGRPAVDDTRLLVEDGNTVLALDTRSGATLWSRPVRHAPLPPPTTLIARDGRVYISETDSVIAMSENDGHTLWNFHPDSQAIVVPAMDTTSLYTGQRGIPVVYAIGLTTGKARWEIDLGAGRNYQYGADVKGMSVSGDTLYVNVRRNLVANGSQTSGVLVAMSAADGREFWRYETSGTFNSFQDEPLLAGRYVTVNDFLGRSVVGYDPAAGREAWRLTSPTNGPDRSIVAGSSVYVAGADATAYAIDVQTGTLRWKHDIGASANGAGTCGDQFYVDNENLLRFDMRTGTLTGRYDPAAPFTSNVASDGERIFVTGEDGVWAFSC